MSTQAHEDPFASLLTLEDTLYTTAYSTGLAAGAKAGKIEGRIFGLEKGFEKFAALGTLHGRSVVWGARLGTAYQDTKGERKECGNVKGVAEKHKQEDLPTMQAESGEERTVEEDVKVVESVLPALPTLPRLPPHITLLHSLTDPPTFSTSNTEEAVADLDDRSKRGTSKAKLIELLIQEPSSAAALEAFGTGGGEGTGSASGAGSPRRKVNVKVRGERVKKEDNMEDFGGSRLLM